MLNSLPESANQISGRFARTGGHQYAGGCTEVNNVLFGDVGDHAIAGHETVFVSTYSLEPPLKYCVIVRLPDDHNGHQRRILMQNPPWDINVDPSPFEIRAHPLFSNGDVGISITHGEYVKADGSSVVVTGSSSANINTHDGTFSPNDAHLQNLPDRPLEDDEIFSFASSVARGGIVVDTFHLLMGNINRIIALSEAFLATDGRVELGDRLFGRKISESKYEQTELAKELRAIPNKTFGDFLKLLQHPFVIAKYSNLSPHLAKMMTFIEGRI
jgi:hypothetical protein